jgi:hypothetical protein
VTWWMQMGSYQTVSRVNFAAALLLLEAAGNRSKP